MPVLVRIAAIATALIAIVVSALALPASAKPPMEAFGDVPEIRAMDLSPDGSKVAFIQRINGIDYLVNYEFATKAWKPLVSVQEIRARSVQFVGNNFIVLRASKAERFFGYRGTHEYSAAFAYDLSKGKIVQLLTRTEKLYPAQTGLGKIVGVDPGGRHVYMPAFETTSDPSLSLWRVSLETGRGEIHVRGTSNTVDWLVDARGKAVMREDFSEKRRVHEVRAGADGKLQLIYTSESENLPGIGVMGISRDQTSLIATAQNDSEFRSLFTVNPISGALTGPVFTRDDADIQNVVIDSNRIVHGVIYSGMRPTYDLFDEQLETDLKSAQNAFPSSSVWLVSWTADWSKLLLLVEGGTSSELYVVFDRATKRATQITLGRTLIKPEDIGEVITIEYKARDGLKIPGLITWPAGVPADQRKNLPLVVMPHGGPEVYDSIGFDWLAQFLANEGYAVLQPNFRGSAGFGKAFRDAGRGEWGRKMQDDITDGVNAMIKMGWADKDRVCIAGWSYGGYAALAGGALTPDHYKCVVSVAGVSHLRDMIATEKRNHGSRSLRAMYWEMLIGDPDRDAKAIDAVSPAKLAENFKAPVLLIHGTEDTNVPARQSDMMNDALKAANKQVEYVRIKGDDHGLLDNDSRKIALTKVAEFLKTHIGPR
jgi:dipeptidyl aminopeptidase/acylaminoacyl peptidase